MSERQEWTESYRRQVGWVEAMALLALGAALSQWGSLDAVKYSGIGLMGTAVYLRFPVVRPLVTWAVQRIPWLADRRTQVEGSTHEDQAE